MFVQQIDLAVREGQEAAFEAALLETRRRVFASPGFRGFAVLEDVAAPSCYLAQVHWESRIELVEHLDSGRFDRCWQPVQPFLTAAPHCRHLIEREGLAFQGPGTEADLDWLRELPRADLRLTDG